MNSDFEKRQENAERYALWMLQQDRFAQSLGIELMHTAPGFCRVSMIVKESMLNAVGMTHGGATFSLADFAFAVASNSHGRSAVALTAQINYPGASRVGDRLTAEAKEASLTARTGLYNIEVCDQQERLVAQFTGTVYRRSDNLSEWMNGEKR